jgi:hypothetical protein
VFEKFAGKHVVFDIRQGLMPEIAAMHETSRNVWHFWAREIFFAIVIIVTAGSKKPVQFYRSWRVFAF